MWPLHTCSKIFWPAADSHLADYSLWCMPVQFRHRLLFGNFQTEWTAEIPQSWICAVEHYRVVFLAVSWLDFQLLGGPLPPSSFSLPTLHFHSSWPECSVTILEGGFPCITVHYQLITCYYNPGSWFDAQFPSSQRWLCLSPCRCKWGGFWSKLTRKTRRQPFQRKISCKWTQERGFRFKVHNAPVREIYFLLSLKLALMTGGKRSSERQMQ